MGPELEKAEREVERYRTFIRLSQEPVAVNDRICQLGSGSVLEGGQSRLKAGCGQNCPPSKSKLTHYRQLRPARIIEDEDELEQLKKKLRRHFAEKRKKK